MNPTPPRKRTPSQREPLVFWLLSAGLLFCLVIFWAVGGARSGIRTVLISAAVAVGLWFAMFVTLMIRIGTRRNRLREAGMRAARTRQANARTRLQWLTGRATSVLGRGPSPQALFRVSAHNVAQGYGMPGGVSRTAVEYLITSRGADPLEAARHVVQYELTLATAALGPLTNYPNHRHFLTRVMRLSLLRTRGHLDAAAFVVDAVEASGLSAANAGNAGNAAGPRAGAPDTSALTAALDWWVTQRDPALVPAHGVQGARRDRRDPSDRGGMDPGITNTPHWFDHGVNDNRDGRDADTPLDGGSPSAWNDAGSWGGHPGESATSHDSAGFGGDGGWGGDGGGSGGDSGGGDGGGGGGDGGGGGGGD